MENICTPWQRAWSPWKQASKDSKDVLECLTQKSVLRCLSKFKLQGQGSKQVLIGNAKTSPILRGCTVDSLANAKGTGNHVWVTGKKWQETLYIRIRFALRGHARTSFKTWKTSWCSPICSLCSHILSIYTCSYLHSRQLQENTLVMVWCAPYWNLHCSRRSKSHRKRSVIAVAISHIKWLSRLQNVGLCDWRIVVEPLRASAALLLAKLGRHARMPGKLKVHEAKKRMVGYFDPSPMSKTGAPPIAKSRALGVTGHATSNPQNCYSPGEFWESKNYCSIVWYIEVLKLGWIQCFDCWESDPGAKSPQQSNLDFCNKCALKFKSNLDQ